MTAPQDPRIDQILDVLLAFARQDFTHKAPISEAHDSIDAIAAGLNMLAEELDGAVASRRELEEAYRSMQEAQARLVHGGKLVAIGQLASGVAHEINNPASWLLGSLAVLDRELSAARRDLDDPAGTASELRTRAQKTLDSVSAWLRESADGLERIVAVTRDLRTFSRADSDDVEPVEVAELVRSACSLARPLLQREARLDLALDESARVLGNRGRLGQVVTNLLVNAAHAVTSPHSGGRHIRVEVLRAAHTVVLAVDDSGPGVPVELRQRVFEPFFTTKEHEEGTGLGLSLVAEIVRAHHGEVRVLDSAFGGARFEVTLPLAKGQPESPPAPQLLSPPRRPRLLLIDDEPRLLQSFALMLRPTADVQVASNGRAALKLLEDDRAFDAILCDLQMPELDGPGLYERVLALAPELSRRIIFTSGGVYQRSVREFVQRMEITVLEKPLREAVLMDAVSRVMARAT